LTNEQAVQEKVVLVGLATSNGGIEAAEGSLDELAALADTAGAEVVDRIVQVRRKPDPATFIGQGKAKEVVAKARMLDAQAIIFDDELSPAQGRNLEDVAAVNPLAPNALKIIDRTGLILDVFAQHSHSAEGNLQVELAQINYMVPRLRGWGEVLSRIGGGAARGGGGAIGTRGPGETQLEVDRRKIQRRLKKLKSDLSDLERTRDIRRKQRVKGSTPQVSLVGYTNAGKSTLLNALTGAGVLVEDRLFSTLDPVARRMELPDGGPAVLIDTVGFVSKLPHQLVEAFRSTLEESLHADLLLHVVDASAVDPRSKAEAVDGVLTEIGAEEIPRLVVLNKADVVSDDDRRRLLTQFPGSVMISAKSGEGVAEMLEEVRRRLDSARTIAVFKVPFDKGKVRSQLHAEGEILEETHDESGTKLVARVPAPLLKRMSEYVSTE
jgi:GTP-binding protein HflX